MITSRFSLNSCLARAVRILLLLSVAAAALPAGALPVGVVNLPPKVSLVRPAPGEGFNNPPEIQIVAEAADPDGFVQSVEVFTDLGSLGKVTLDPNVATLVNPLQWTWNNPPAGDHKIVAQAVDNTGGSSFSESLVVTIKRDASPSPATLTFIKPADGAVLPFSDPVSIELTAVDPNGDIRHVEFFANGNYIGRSEHLTKEAVIPGRPITHFLEWKPVTLGSYRLIARAIDTQGNPAESAALSISVGSNLPIVSIMASFPDTSEPGPTVRIRPGAFTFKRTGDVSKPLMVYLRYEGSATPDLDYKRLPETVTFLAGASDAELLVEPMEDATSEPTESVIATLFEPPFDRLPDQIIDPQFQTAKVLIHDTSSGGGAATLEITEPKDGQEFQSGEKLVIAATAIDPSGYIARVAFYDFDKEIGVSQIYFFRAPNPGTPVYHSFDWQNPTPGEHVITARAVDSNGNPISSKPVRIKVGGESTLPIVEVMALDSEATEFSPLVDAVDPARFRSRAVAILPKNFMSCSRSTAVQSRTKTIAVRIGLVRMAPGEREAVVEIVPLADELTETMETVLLRLEDPMSISSLPVPPSPYQMNAFSRSATAVIYDRARPEHGDLAFALPDQGEVFQSGQPISMLVAAYHPGFDLSHVDFYAGEKLIGSSDIVFAVRSFRAD